MIFRFGLLIFAAAGIAVPVAAAGPTVEAMHHFRTTHVVPAPGLVRAGDGSYYGVTTNGGTSSVGSVFRFTAGGQLETVYSFAPFELGGVPAGDLALGRDRALYGVSSSGSGSRQIFRVTTSGEFRSWWGDFLVSGDFLNPLVVGTDGGLYGSARAGGARNGGTIFRFTPAIGFRAISK